MSAFSDYFQSSQTGNEEQTLHEIHSCPELIECIQQVGFLPLLESGVRGYSAEALMADIDDSKYVIMLDHQPNDYDAIAKAAPDLVISGHTHGGHIFPAGPVGLLMGANDAVYGLETRENTSFIVTSGMSGWEIPFKTFCVSEYVVIDIQTK